MKITCLDDKDETQNTFLCKFNQHTVLMNCPLETLTIPKPEYDTNMNEEPSAQGLSSILSTFSHHGKQALDTQYSSLASSINNCDYTTVFRVPDFSLIDMDSIDLVLISNYKLMLGLPYLTEYLGYKGKIITTEPTVEYAKQRMEELVKYHGQTTSTIDPSSSTYALQLLNETGKGWRSLYTLKDVISCIDKIQIVRYTQTLSLFSTLNVSAYSSGYCLGSSNWLLETSARKIAFLSSSSTCANLHPAPFDADILKGTDVVVVGGLSRLTEKDVSFDRAKAKILSQIGRTIHAQHNIILVTPVTGILFDLIGDIDGYFKSIGKEVGAENHQTPIYVASPVADQSLKYANICGEWMNSGRHDLLYLPEMPLAHGEFLAKGAIQTLSTMEAVSMNGKKLREPCIVFTGDSTCITKGSLPWFLNEWDQPETNVCLFIDPDTKLEFQEDIPEGCKINCSRIPLDTTLKLGNIPSLLHTYWETNPDNTRHLLIPSMQGAELVKQEQSRSTVHIYHPGQVINIDLNRDWENVTLTEKLAITISPTNLPTQNGLSDMAWAPIHGSLNYYNNQLQIQPTTSLGNDLTNAAWQPTKHTVNAELSAIIMRFEENSIPIHITQDADGIITIELPVDMDAKIVMNYDHTTIVASDEKVRTWLRKIALIDMQ